MSADKDIVLADYWLQMATNDLCDQARARIAVEVRAHYLDLVEAHAVEGMPLIEARLKALEDLGDAKVAARKFRKQHWTKNDEKRLQGTIRYNKTAGPLFGFLLFAGSIFMISPASSRIAKIEFGIAQFVTFVVLPAAASLFARRVKGQNGIQAALLSGMGVNIVTGGFCMIFFFLMMDWTTPHLYTLLAAILLGNMSSPSQAIPSYFLLRKFRREQKCQCEGLHAD